MIEILELLMTVLSVLVSVGLIAFAIMLTSALTLAIVAFLKLKELFQRTRKARKETRENGAFS
jgi:hypothetical protein